MVLKLLLDNFGLEFDQSKFIFSQLIALIAGLLFRRIFPACPNNYFKRQLVATCFGLYLGYFVFENDFVHLIIVSTFSHCILNICSRHYVHLIVFVFTIIYLSFVHLYFQINFYGQKNFDITSPMMIFVQKITYIAFSYADGAKSAQNLNEYQKSNALTKLPGIIEYYSYLFHFQGIIVGPGCNFKDFKEFMDGTNILKHQKDSKSNDPSVKKALFKKILTVIVLIVLFLKLTSKYSYISLLEPEILNKPFWSRVLYLHLACECQRLYYYIPWTLSDAVNNASGFGFSGYDQKDEPKWDLLTNVKILELETSTSLKYLIDNWHIQTKNWLRRILFERLPKGKTLGVFIISCVWHGFYPGYYLSFLFSAFVIYVGRGIRRNVRPIFLKNNALIKVYAVITYIGTQLAIAYMIGPFFVLTMDSSLKFLNSFYWIGHILTLILLLILPRKSFKSKSY